MQQRKSPLGRPSGTDGSDYSYRMVVDSSKYFHSPKPLINPFFSINFSLIPFYGLLIRVSTCCKGEETSLCVIYHRGTIDFFI